MGLNGKEVFTPTGLKVANWLIEKSFKRITPLALSWAHLSKFSSHSHEQGEFKGGKKCFLHQKDLEFVVLSVSMESSNKENDSCGVDTSLPLTAITYLKIVLSIWLFNFVLMPVFSSLQFSLVSRAKFTPPCHLSDRWCSAALAWVWIIVSDHLLWLQSGDTRPLIGQHRSRDLNTGLWLAHADSLWLAWIMMMASGLENINTRSRGRHSKWLTDTNLTHSVDKRPSVSIIASCFSASNKQE